MCVCVSALFLCVARVGEANLTCVFPQCQLGVSHLIESVFLLVSVQQKAWLRKLHRQSVHHIYGHLQFGLKKSGKI